MKNLIFKNDNFYLVDDLGKNAGKTRKVSGYNIDTISKTNMPHQFFNNKIVIYGTHTCPYCLGIVEFLKGKPKLYKKLIFVAIDTEPVMFFNRPAIFTLLKSQIKKHRTIPMVFDDGVFIGGCDDSKIYYEKL